MFTKPFKNGMSPEVAILGADQKEGASEDENAVEWEVVILVRVGNIALRMLRTTSNSG